MSLKWTRIIALNANAGAFVSISATRTSRYVLVDEVPNPGAALTPPFVPQGLSYQLPDDSFATTIDNVPGQPIEIGNPLARENAMGSVVGQLGQQFPGGQTTTATVLLKAKSATANAVYVRVSEVS